MSCQFYKWNGGIFGDYWCIKNDCRIPSDHYYKYCRDYNYRDCSIYKQTNSTSCFITTVVCNILGKKDNDELLENFRMFRNNILQPNKEYHNILKEYDVIGAKLADCIINDKDKVEMSLGLFTNALTPINEKIKNKEYDEAIEMYYLMTLLLINYYGLKHEYNVIKEKNYEYENFIPEKAGHGLVKCKAKSSNL